MADKSKFGARRLLVLSGYCLRNRNATSHVLIKWKLEGSRDGEKWTRLDPPLHSREEYREDPRLLRPAASTAYIALAEPDMGGSPEEELAYAYRSFRVVQMGTNSSGSHNLVLSGLELYGKAVQGRWG